MKFELFGFQEEKKLQLRESVAIARETFNKFKRQQIISFTAPTGAGKTIILASLVEQIYTGDENFLSEPNAIFVWLSDSPDLNRQSMDKFISCADGINFSQLVMISEESFHERVLADGKIYFLNTQKLGKSSRLTQKSDARQFTIWELLQNTIAEKSDRFCVIIDEAHRGIQGTEAARATTIMQKFIKGSAADNLSPCPVVIGVSATPERFDNFVRGLQSTIHKVVTTAEEVTRAGLLKEKVIVKFPAAAVENDMSIFRAAVEDWQDKCASWARHFKLYPADKKFSPALLIQVQNAGENISETDLDECVKKIFEQTGRKFAVGEIVHTFGEKIKLTLNGLKIPYAEPKNISASDEIKIIFFKEKLSTGWDCPRAETMMSFRRAVDSTYIAQLLGRMIRTPLQKKIFDDVTLNNVKLFLPYFDRETVLQIVEQLKSPTENYIPARVEAETVTEPTTEILTLTVDAVHENIFESSAPISEKKFSPNQIEQTNIFGEENFADEKVAEIADKKNSAPSQKTSLEKVSAEENFVLRGFEEIDRVAIARAINAMNLLTYSVQTGGVKDYFKSLFRLAHFITQSGLAKSENVFDDVIGEVVEQIGEYISELKSSGEYEKIFRKIREFKLSERIVDVARMEISGGRQETLFAVDSDIERQFAKAEAKLRREGIANAYVGRGNFDECESLKIDVIIFAAEEKNFARLDVWAKEKFFALQDFWRQKFGRSSKTLSEEYNLIIAESSEVGKLNYTLPEKIEVPFDADGKIYTDHLFVNQRSGIARIKLNSWEEGVLREEQRREDFVCWLRNPPRKKWSLCVPYEMGEKILPTFPDLLIVRRDADGNFVVDILEPHAQHFADNLPKAKGFARYAGKNLPVEKMQLIWKPDEHKNKFLRLDMTKSAIREKVLRANNHEDLRKIFLECAFSESFVKG